MNEKHILGRVQVTRVCNQDCKFCAAPPGDEDLTLDEIKSKIIELKKLGTTELMLTGGEPTLREDLVDIIKFTKEQEFPEITIQTNASKLNHALLKKLQSFEVRFNVSFHSYTKEIYKKTSKHDNFDEVVKNIKLLGDMGFYVYPTIVISSFNYKKLVNLVTFIKYEFPFITHLSFNYIDPTGRAKKNTETVPTYSETELYIHLMVKFLKKNHMSFRIERVPLCYMSGFEEFSSDIRRDIFDEKRMMYHLQSPGEEDYNLFIEKKSGFQYAKQCASCRIKGICAGINPNYVKIHGDKEVFPVFDNPKGLIERVKNSKISIDIDKTFQRIVKQDLDMFKYAIDTKTNKNNIYDTFSFFLTEPLRYKDEKYIMNHWKEHLSEIKKGKKPNLLSFYVHIPYCISNCNFCVYPSTTLKTNKQVSDYIKFLQTQAKNFAPIFKGHTFKTLYFGGGTPSVMNAKQMDELFTTLEKLYDFDKYAEKAIELNPRNTDLDKLKILEKHGFNKISIGVQSFTPEVLNQNSRGYQNETTVKKCIKMIKSLNLNLLNVDLLLGLKGDTIKDFLNTFAKLCDYGPDIIVIYPIKTNDNYIKKNYITEEKFEKFYYPLFEGVTKVLPQLALKKGYHIKKNTENNSLVAPMVYFNPNKKFKKIVAGYSHFSLKPFSNFCLGYYSHSRISGKIDYRYIDKDNFDSMFLKKFSTDPKDYVYNVDKFAPHFEKVKFIVEEFYESWQVPRKKYKEFYNSDILDDFPYAIRALKYLKLIKITEDTIFFRKIDEREIYPYMLFFAGRDWVKKRLPR